MPRPRQVPLSKERIVEETLRIIDREGLPHLSMRRIGAGLGVEAMALYRYYPQKDAILNDVVDLVVGRPAYPRVGTWPRSLRLLSLELRARVLAHPNAMPLVASRWLQTKAFRDILEEAEAEIGSLRIDAPALLHAVMSLLLGYCWLEVGAFVGSMPEDGGLTRRSVPTDRFQTGPHGSEGGAATEQFLAELDLLLAGAAAGRTRLVVAGDLEAEDASSH
jgi:TetR/AcrR family transcriptional regulator, tetracycline repressor protein